MTRDTQSIIKTTPKTIASPLTPTVAIPPEGRPGGLASPPKRIQLSRRRGWRKPPNTVVVARPTKWGNPFRATEDYPVERAVADYDKWLHTDPQGIETLHAAKVVLCGMNLACWCRPGTPCHAEVLLKLVNGDPKIPAKDDSLRVHVENR